MRTTRPEIVFDAFNKEHRKLYTTYRKDKSWGNIPVRFIIPGTFGVTIGHIERDLLDFYTQKEFQKETVNGNSTSISTKKK
jgi:hypothetical protein